jgi:hypothetical protein
LSVLSLVLPADAAAAANFAVLLCLLSTREKGKGGMNGFSLYGNGNRWWTLFFPHPPSHPYPSGQCDDGELLV